MTYGDKRCLVCVGVVEFAFGWLNSLRELKAPVGALKLWHSAFNQCAALIQRISDACNVAAAIFNDCVRRCLATSPLKNQQSAIREMECGVTFGSSFLIPDHRLFAR